MMERMLIASAVIFVLSLLWHGAVQAGRAFAVRHPELGRYREEGGACGVSCGCPGKSACRKKQNRAPVALYTNNNL